MLPQKHNGNQQPSFGFCVSRVGLLEPFLLLARKLMRSPSLCPLPANGRRR